MRTCNRCKREHTRNHGWCAKCHADNMKNWRKEHPLTEAQKRKDIARSYAGVYKRRGYIEEKSCRVCGDKAEMHHPDYNQPILIDWLCREHHLELHNEKI